MTTITFHPPPGLVNDLTPFEAGDAWWTGNNVRFTEMGAQPIGGWTQSFTGMSGTPKNILAWTQNDGSSRVAWATTTKLYIDGTSNDVTPAGFVSTNRWSLDTYGQTLMAVPTGGTLYQWSNNTAVAAAVIATAPASITAMVVRNRQVIAFGCNEEVSTTFNGLCVRWSDFEDATNWTTTATNNAGEYILEGPGRIVTARKVGDYVAILTTDSLWLMTYVGDPSQTFQFTKAGSGCGCIGLDAVVSANGVLYWMTQDYLFYSWSPGSIPQPIPCPVQQTVQAAVNTSKTAAVRIFACYNAKFGEVWFFYPTGSSSSANPTRYAAVSVKTGKWFLGQLARTAMSQGILFLYGATSGGVAFIHENGNRGISTDSLSWSITSGCYYLNDTQDRLMLRDVCPDFAAGSPAQAGTVSIGIGVFDRAQNDTSFTAAQTVTIPGDLTIIRRNLRVSGRLIQVQISGNDTTGTTDTACHIGKLTFDAVKLGQR